MIDGFGGKMDGGGAWEKTSADCELQGGGATELFFLFFFEGVKTLLLPHRDHKAAAIVLFLNTAPRPLRIIWVYEYNMRVRRLGGRVSS